MLSSSEYERAVLALPLGEAPRLHPLVGALEQRGLVDIDMLVAHEGAQQLMGRERALGMGRDQMGIAVEIGVDAIDRLVLGGVIGVALLRRQMRRDHLAAAIEFG